MSEIYLTSDLHFNHDKEFIWKTRGYNSVEEMNESIISKYNLIVKDDDIVYILGDCIMGDLEGGLPLLKQLKGRKFLAIGNHDTNNRLKAFKENNIFEDIQMGYRIKYKKKNYLLTHYPTIVENGDRCDMINIHGHTHSISEISSYLYCYNVNVDAWSAPVSLDFIHEDIKLNHEKYWKKK